MIVTLENEYLTVQIETLGAELRSIRDAEGCEYLWQGDPAFWADRAPILFPVIGRLHEKRWQNGDVSCPIDIHGFASSSEFTVQEKRKDRVSMYLCASPESKRAYPFDFSLNVAYMLRKNSVQVSFAVYNPGNEALPFAIGGHPGFNVPLESGRSFEDYILEFPRACKPDRVGFSENILLNGRYDPFPLEDGMRISLRHEIFDMDAIILKNVCKEVALRSSCGGKGIRVAFPDMPYLGIWHRPETNAPYVCIEPWSSLPGRDGVVEDLNCRSDFVHLAAGETYHNVWSIDLLQEA